MRIIVRALEPVLLAVRVSRLQIQRSDAGGRGRGSSTLFQVRRARRLRVQEPEQRLLRLADVSRPAAVPAAADCGILFVAFGRRDYAVQVVERLVRGDRGDRVRRRRQRLDRRGTATVQSRRHGADARLDRARFGGRDHRPVVIHHLFALVLLYGRHAVLGALAADHRRVGAPLEQLDARSATTGRRRPAFDQLGHLVLQIADPVRQPDVFRLVRVLRPVCVFGPGPARVQFTPQRRQLQLVRGRSVVHDNHAHRRRRHFQQPVQVVLVLHRQHHFAVYFQQSATIVTVTRDN